MGQIPASLRQMNGPLIAPVLVFAAAVTLLPRAVFCQTPNTPTIRVESKEVLVPVFVFDKKIMSSPFAEKTPYDFQNDEVLGLAAKDFHLFEDGKEQTIQSVRWVPEFDAVNVRDNVSNHNEISRDTPRGKWITPNTLRPFPVSKDWPAWLVNYDHFYVLGYVPPQSSAGSCRRIEVNVDRPGSVVYARSEYCNAVHSSSDPLIGTAFSHQLEEYARLDETGKISLSVQTTIFSREENPALVDVAIEFPWNSLSWHWKKGPLKGMATFSAEIGILGLVYKRDGQIVVARFSSLGCCPSDLPFFQRGGEEANPATAFWNIPTGYETQLDLPPGKYNLIVVLSDGSKFGRIERPLTVEPYPAKQLAISSVMLSRQYRDAVVAAKEEAETHFAPEYVPFVSNGVQFAPAGETRFQKNDPLFVYFEVYEPLLASTPSTAVQTRMRITNLKNGQLKVDTGFRSAAAWMKPGSPVIRVAEQVVLKNLPPGSYQLDLQAADSAGKISATSTTTFTIAGSGIFRPS